MAISTGAALLGGTLLGGATSLIGGSKAASSAKKAAAIQAQSETAALEYLKEREALPQALREGALTGLGAEYGLTLDEQGNVISDESTISERALASPFYTTSRDIGEEAIMRHQAMTGGLRSGNTQDALARANQQLYAQSYAQQIAGLEGISNLPSNASAIAAVTAGIGRTLAQGRIAGAQSRQQGVSDFVNIGLGSLGTAIKEGII